MISASIPNPVPESGHFKRALPGHFWQAPKPALFALRVAAAFRPATRLFLVSAAFLLAARRFRVRAAFWPGVKSSI
jgi:hypothetical protein